MKRAVPHTRPVDSTYLGSSHVTRGEVRGAERQEGGGSSEVVSLVLDCAFDNPRQDGGFHDYQLTTVWIS